MSTNDSSDPLRQRLADLLEALPQSARFDQLGAELVRTIAAIDADQQPAALVLALPVDHLDMVPDDPMYGFQHFWEAWPQRGGKRLYRARAEAHWQPLTLRQRKAAWRGAVHYAQACGMGTQGAMDAFRWLRDRSWEDWQDAPTAQARPGNAATSIAAAVANIRAGQSSLLPDLPPAPAAARALGGAR